MNFTLCKFLGLLRSKNKENTKQYGRRKLAQLWRVLEICTGYINCRFIKSKDMKKIKLIGNGKYIKSH